LADTVGIGTPSTVAELVGRLVTLDAPPPLEFHAHNDFGMATANAVSALSAGAEAASVTVNGLGERAGNAALEEVAMALRHCAGLACGVDPHLLGPLSAVVAAAAKRPVSRSKPIVGADVTRHESGVHCRGLIRDAISYQPFDPRELGRGPAELLAGKHSGSTGLRHVLHQMGVPIERNQARALLPLIRRRAQELKRTLTTEEVRGIYEGMCSGVNPDHARQARR